MTFTYIANMDKATLVIGLEFGEDLEELKGRSTSILFVPGSHIPAVDTPGPISRCMLELHFWLCSSMEKQSYSLLSGYIPPPLRW